MSAAPKGFAALAKSKAERKLLRFAERRRVAGAALQAEIFSQRCRINRRSTEIGARAKNKPVGEIIYAIGAISISAAGVVRACQR